MHENNEWVTFFNGHAPVYNDNCFTKNTLEEVDFLITELSLSPGAHILDIGCGTGRHSVELARRGYVVTGLDISSGMLKEAEKRAEEAHVTVTWLQADAKNFSFETQFDSVICLCEGAFGLLGGNDDAITQPLAILGNIAKSMKPQARCLFTVLNGFAMVRRHSPQSVEQGRFDPLSLTERSECNTPENTTPIPLRERAFVPTELKLLFRLAGLDILGIWGGTAGSWHKKAINLDEIEIMVLAQKPNPGKTEK